MNIKKAIKIKIIKWTNRTVKIEKNVAIGWKSFFEGYNKIGKGSEFVGQMGHCSYIGSGCKITASIGRYCSISSNVKTIAGTHPSRDWVSTSPVFYSTAVQCGKTYVKEQCFEENTSRVSIGNDVWIGSNVLLIGGIEIGDGAIVAAGAVVTKNVPSYSVVAGVPAKVIRYRFSSAQIDKLLKIKWWNRDEEWIIQHTKIFANIDKFLAEVNE